MSRNVYGDSLDKGIDGRGVDIALQRADDLDNACLNYLKTLQTPRVLDIGCGAGGQSIRMAQVGACVVGVDLEDFFIEFARLNQVNGLNQEQLTFTSGNVVDVLPKLDSFDSALSQRTFHYLPYQTALEVLQELKKHVTGKLFISLSGFKSELGSGYPDRDKPVEQRFSKLSDEMSAKHHIREPLCLYTEEEARELLEKAGWSVENIYSSSFGNIKVIAR